MGKIFYSMAGEGRGHAVRVRTLVEHLRHDHQLTLFAPGEAHDFLEPFYGNGSVPNVTLVNIPGIVFQYSNRKLDLLKTIWTGMGYSWSELTPLVNELAKRIQAENPDLIISDFEPALPRAATKCGRDFIAMDHQHVLLAYDLSRLPADLQNYAWMMSIVVKMYYGTPKLAVASSFFSPPLKPGFEAVRQIGPLLRPEITDSQPTTGDFLLSYLRKQTPESVVDALAATGRVIRVYGLGDRPARGNLQFFPINEQGFVRDLASCAGLVSAAGNQLLGEALFLGKPVFAMPEESHHEQLINANFIQQMGVGDFVTLETVTANHLETFCQNLPGYREQLAPLCGHLNGTPQALAIIREQLTNQNNRPAVA